MPNELTTRLDRVIAATFAEGFTVLETDQREHPPQYSVLVGSTVDLRRTACFRLDGVWLEAFIPELNVQCALLDEQDERDADGDLGRLCRALRVYLRGESHIDRRPRLLPPGLKTVVRIELDGQRWSLGRNRWSVH
ncbi:hypothetical protein [Glutamicibacter soli]|uniref:Uncharacterized protein n=1 Tax=Glutamicibacter soli TaxID=453836 RepID=A0A6L9G9D2_9MICC|nr:hypothetical protein [Glutamicibacter soli]NAZ17768.1 hypothetical protein [Glutamicibacter soli]